MKAYPYMWWLTRRLCAIGKRMQKQARSFVIDPALLSLKSPSLVDDYRMRYAYYRTEAWFAYELKCKTRSVSCAVGEHIFAFHLYPYFVWKIILAIIKPALEILFIRRDSFLVYHLALAVFANEAKSRRQKEN